MMQFVNACHFGRLHFEQGHEERERRFGSLVLVHAIGMKAIPASARQYIVERDLEIVLAEKPAKDSPGFVKPLAFFRQPVYLKASGNGGASLYRLLIETRLFTSLDKESGRGLRHRFRLP